MANKFRKVEEPDTNAVSVTVWSGDDGPRGSVQGPIVAKREITFEITNQEDGLPIKQALNSAIALSRKHNTEIVIIDHNHIWQSEWGELS